LYLRSMLVKPRVKTILHRGLWKAFNIFSVITCVGMLGISSVSIYTNIYVHLVFAFALFIGGIFIMFISTIMDHTMRLPLSPTVMYLRYSLTVVGILSGVALIFCFVTYPFLGSILEMISVASITAYFCTFAYKLEKIDSRTVTLWTYMHRIADEPVNHPSSRYRIDQ
jgi:hypothetical protein